MRRQVEAVELQIDMRLQMAEPAREAAIAGDPDPVRVQHHHADPLRTGELDEVEDLRVDCRLAARELHYLRRALRGDEAIEHEVDLLQRERVAVRLMA